MHLLAYYYLAQPAWFTAMNATASSRIININSCDIKQPGFNMPGTSAAYLRAIAWPEAALLRAWAHAHLHSITVLA
jgi:hypothetical protein